MKLLSYVTALFLSMACTSICDVQAIAEESLPAKTGAYTEYRAVTSEEKAMLDKAVEAFLATKEVCTQKGCYIPEPWAALEDCNPTQVRTQVVAGTNYQFKCEDFIITVFKPLPGQGEARVSDVDFINKKAMATFKVKASADDLDLYATVFRPEGTPSGVLLVVHGMSEHRKRYYPFMEWMTSKGYVTVCYDHRGHGQSIKDPDDLGFMYDGGWSALIEDCGVIVNWIGDNFPGYKVSLFGHSMGSMVVRSYAKRYDDKLDCLIVCGCPGENPKAKMGVKMAKFFGKLCGWHKRSKILEKASTGKFEKQFAYEGVPRSWSCSDLEVVKQFADDPLCGFPFTNNGYYNLSSLMLDCYSKDGWKMSNPDLPIKFVSGADDPCRVSDEVFNNAVELMRTVGYKNVTSHLYPGVRHQLLKDKGYMQAWEDIYKFVKIKN